MIIETFLNSCFCV